MKTNIAGITVLEFLSSYQMEPCRLRSTVRVCMDIELTTDQPSATAIRLQTLQALMEEHVKEIPKLHADYDYLKYRCEKLLAERDALRDACRLAERTFSLPAGTRPSQEAVALDKLRAALALSQPERGVV